jgi:uncharacterized protein YukJ
LTLRYGFVKATLLGDAWLKATRERRETQYHIHLSLDVGGAPWDTAINVGTNDADDSVRYRIAFDYHHPITQVLASAAAGATDLTGQHRLPALDFQRSDILAETGPWRLSDSMDGSTDPRPVSTLMRLFDKARQSGATVFVFGRFYTDGNGIHDTHMNQGSTGRFVHRQDDDSNDHNDIWQDGAVLVWFGGDQWTAYFSVFEKQFLPTDELGNPAQGSQPVGGGQ